MVISGLWRTIKRIPSLGERARREPIFLAGLAMAALQALTEANASGLGTEDAWLFVADAALVWLARELVVPMAKVRTGEYEVEEVVAAPYIDE